MNMDINYNTQYQQEAIHYVLCFIQHNTISTFFFFWIFLRHNFFSFYLQMTNKFKTMKKNTENVLVPHLMSDRIHHILVQKIFFFYVLIK